MPKKRTKREYIALAESLGGITDSRIEVEWTTFTDQYNAEEFYAILEEEGVAFYRQGIQRGNKVAWYNN